MSRTTQKDTLPTSDHYKEWRDFHQNFPAPPWKAWSSWFSWGSPVGLGLFLVAIATAIWICTQAF